MAENSEQIIERGVREGKLDRVDKLIGEDASTHPPEAPEPPTAEAMSPVSDAGPHLDALAKLREPFPPNQISQLPKETKNQRLERTEKRQGGISCSLCGGWHHRDAAHVPYVGHAAITDRLLSVDPLWSWEPVAWTPEGLPRFDASGGMWIRLTVAGMTRLGYGHGAQKPNQDPGAREKEVIGDALRNAAMRFGAALDLWHKGDLHVDEDTVNENTEGGDPTADPTAGAPEGLFINDEQRDRILRAAEKAGVEARAICERYGIDALPQLHADNFDTLMESLKMTAKKKSRPKPLLPDEGGGDVLDDSIPF